MPVKKNTPTETFGLKVLGSKAAYRFDSPDASMLEAFPNRHPERDYVVEFEHPEFTSLCPMTGQPDFAVIRVRYIPAAKCVESKSFKLYMAAYRNHGSFMESIVNKIADDLIAVLSPRRLTVEGFFNIRGGSRITVRVEHMDAAVKNRSALQTLW